MKQGWRVTPAGGDPRESATENRPPHRSNPAARVKRCGKSAPRAPVTAAARQTPPGARPNRGDAPDIRQACFKPRIARSCVARVGCLSAAAMRRLEEWLPVPIRSVFADTVGTTEPGLQAPWHIDSTLTPSPSPSPSPQPQPAHAELVEALAQFVGWVMAYRGTQMWRACFDKLSMSGVGGVGIAG